jgi:hypothetical protein
MNYESLTAQATLERKPAPEIQGSHSPAGYSLPPAGDERSSARSGGGARSVERSGCGQRVGDTTSGVRTIQLDSAAVAAALSRRLYAAGVPVTPERAVILAEALTLVSPVSRRSLYCTARAVFVSAPAHLPVFDRVFASVFGGCPDADGERAHNGDAVDDWRRAEEASTDRRTTT